MIAFGPVVILALCLLAAWMGIMAVLRVCRVPRGVEAGGSCGLCGYAYSGWQRCPECGGSVAEEGIATPRLMLKHRGSLRGALFSLTLLALALVFLFTGITLGVCQAAGWNQHVRQTAYGRIPPLHTNPSGTPPLNTPLDVIIHKDFIGPSVHNPTGGEILVVIKPSAAVATSADRPATVGEWHATYDVWRDRLTVRDAAGRSREASILSTATVDQFLAEAVPELTQADRARAARQIAEEVDVMNRVDANVSFPILQERGSSMQTTPSLPFAVFGKKGVTAAMLLAGIVSGALYVVAIWLVLKRRRRLMQRVQRPTELSSLAGV